MQTRCHFTR